MKSKSYLIVLCVMMFCAIPGVLLAETLAPYLGVQLSQESLPQLLVKHLRLEPNRGVLIQNIQVDSPADKAGLDKDDIIVEFNGQPVGSHAELFTAIKSSDLSQAVSLGVIQSGELMQVPVQLEAQTPENTMNVQWKYPIEAWASYIYRPGRVFLKPSQLNIDIPQTNRTIQGSFPQDLLQGLSVSQTYLYQHGAGDNAFTVSIVGNPELADTKIAVKAGVNEYAATVGTIHEIPEAFQDVVAEDLDKSKQYKVSNSTVEIPEIFHLDPNTFGFSISLKPQDGSIGLPDNIIKKFTQPEIHQAELENSIEQLQLRIEELEKQMQDKRNQFKQDKQ